MCANYHGISDNGANSFAEGDDGEVAFQYYQQSDPSAPIQPVGTSYDREYQYAPHYRVFKEVKGAENGLSGSTSQIKFEDPDNAFMMEYVRKSNEGPTDFCYLAYILFWLQGAGTLLCWNSFISAPDYFNALYGPSTFFYFTLAFSYSQLLGVLLMVKLSEKLPYLFSIGMSYGVTFAVLVAIPVMGYLGFVGTPGLITTIALILLSAMTSSVINALVFSLSGKLPPQCIQGVVGGQGVAGVIVSLLKVITKLIFDKKHNVNDEPGMTSSMMISTSVYFFSDAVLVVLCILSLAIVLRLPFVQFHLARVSFLHFCLLIHSPYLPGDSLKSKGTIENKSLLQENAINNEINDETAEDEKEAEQKPSIVAIMKKIWLMPFIIFVNYVVTIAVFPGIVVNIPTVYPKQIGDWLPVILVTAYNVFDLVGRSLPKFVILFSRRTIAIPTLLRIIFVPLFILCIRPKLFQHDIISVILTSALGITNGYCTSLIMMYTPSNVENFEKGVTSSLMAFFIIFGITVGSHVSMLIGYLVL